MKKIRHKILLSLLTTSFLFIIIIGIYSMLSLFDMHNKEINTIDTLLNDDYDQLIKDEVETAINVINFYYDAYKAGKLTEEEAKEEAKEAVKALRYNEDGYFWIDDTKGYLVAHPIQPEDEGKDRIELTDANGVALIKDIISAATEGKNSGYTDFEWIKPEDVESGIASPKRAYSKLFEPWSWIVSTGNYIDDIDLVVENKKIELTKKLQVNFNSLLIITLSSLVGISISAYFLSKVITKPIISLVKAFQKDEHGRISIQEISIRSKDEIGLLAETLNEMSSQIRTFIHGVVKESENVVVSRLKSSRAN